MFINRNIYQIKFNGVNFRATFNNSQLPGFQNISMETHIAMIDDISNILFKCIITNLL